MTIISGAGAISSVVPDLLVQVLPPALASIAGVQTNVLGIVGTAPWGPKNSAVPLSTGADYARLFGGMVARKFDAGTTVAVAIQQGANNFRVSRVSDGTDTAASATVQTSGLTVTSLYTGSGANADTVTLGPGSAAGTFKAVVSRPGQASEVFDNVGLGATGNAIWLALAAAINSGTGVNRAASQLIVATAGASTTAPTAGSVTLTGGTDGATGVTATTLIGADTTPRQGMYALRGTGAAVVVLSDCDASATWPTQIAYGFSEGSFMVMVGPAGEFVNPTQVAANKAAAGLDTYAGKLLVGDWIYWLDPVNGVRLVSPQGVTAGQRVNLGPQQAGLNKPMFGIVATQKSFAGQTYSAAELALIGAAGLDVITNPVPGGSYFGLRFGQNTSSNTAIHGDEYTTLTNFLAASINLGLGRFVGRLQTPDEQRQAKNAIGGMLDGLWSRNIIGNAAGTQPYSVTLDATNNPASQAASGIQQANVLVQYLSTVRTFLINLTGGASVTLPTATPATTA